MPHIYITLFILWLGHFLVDSMIGIWAVYKTLAGLDLAIAGLIAGVSAFAGEGLQLVFGSLSDRGYRQLLIGCGILMTATSALMGYTTDYALLFLLFMLTCIGSGAFHPSAAGLAGTLLPKRKGLFLAIFSAGGALGLAVSQMLFSTAYTSYQGATAFLALPVIGLAVGLVFYKLAEVPRVSTGRRIDLKMFGNFFRHRTLRHIYYVQLFTQSLFWGFVFLLPDLLAYRGYPDAVTLGGGHFFLVIGGAFMIIPGGHLADRFSPRSVLIAAQAIGITAFYTLLVFPALSSGALLGLLFVVGSSLGVVSPVCIAMGTGIVPSRPGMVSAFLMGLVWCVAEGLGQGGGGLLSTFFEDNKAANTLEMLGGFLFCSFAAAYRLPKVLAAEEQFEVAR